MAIVLAKTHLELMAIVANRLRAAPLALRLRRASELARQRSRLLSDDRTFGDHPTTRDADS